MHIGIGPAIVTTSSLTATSVTISWSPQPAQFHLPVVEYTVSLTRVTGSGQVLCTQVIDSRPAITTTDTSMSFTDLEEFSNYTVTVTTTFNVFGSNMTEVADDMMFTTPSAGMYNCHNYTGVETATKKWGVGPNFATSPGLPLLLINYYNAKGRKNKERKPGTEAL